MFEIATLIQTHKVEDFPVVLLDREFWEPLLNFMNARFLGRRTVDPADVGRLRITDSPEQAVDSLTGRAMQRFGLTHGPRLRRRWFLWE